MDKPNVVYPYNRILFGKKKKAVLINATAWINLINIILNKRNKSQKIHIA